MGAGVYVEVESNDSITLEEIDDCRMGESGTLARHALAIDHDARSESTELFAGCG